MKPPCPQCQCTNQIILDTRKKSKSLYKRRYQCMECAKVFSAYAEYSSHETETGIFYTTIFTYTKYKAHNRNQEINHEKTNHS